ncbi:MAG TPA: helix-turn-helix domain-containing protein [Roseiflexaceae bacterium]|nr:helix-turn-helix domain-containing protein [Roseiflexaceae bacterium]
MIEENRASERPKPDDEFVITNLETLKVISEPLRLQLLELLADEPRTVKQLAGELNMASTRLYYHINLLELHGLIRVTGTRIVSGIIEKQYQVTARRFRVERSLLSLAPSAGDEPLDTLMSSIFEQLRSEIMTSAQRGLIDFSPDAPRDRGLLISRTLGALPAERAAEFYARLEALVKEFDATAADTANDDPHIFGLAVVMYPVNPPQFKEEAGDG